MTYDPFCENDPYGKILTIQEPIRMPGSASGQPSYMIIFFIVITCLLVIEKEKFCLSHSLE